jgi:phosphatidylserine decarboxylase
MKFIKEFNDFEEIDLLTDDVIKTMSKQKIMKILFKYRNSDIGDKLWKIINRFSVDDEGNIYDTPDEWFEDKEYKTFMEYFRRKISDDKMSEIVSQTENLMSLPCECNVESIGDFSNTESIVRLKKPTSDVVEDLRRIGIDNIDELAFINLKLLKVYYHRVHSPVKGVIDQIVEISPENNFFGNNNLWIVKIDTENLGEIYLLLVGELSIQDFIFKASPGEKINMFQEIGNFEWASQVIIIYDPKFVDGMQIKPGKKYFMGKRIF